ncbi:MAG: hypothetical protein M0Z28_21205, partial [Rhodospirillales bacterium]|nr:hypothetical protein [Rhodospirillales bacterium]
MIGVLVRLAAPIAAFTAIPWPGPGRGCTAKRSAGGQSAAEDGGRRLFCLAMQSAPLTRGPHRACA